MDNETMYPVLEEAARRFHNSHVEATGGGVLFDALPVLTQTAIVDNMRKAFSAVAEFSSEKGYGQRTRMMRALIDATETLVSDDEALNEAIAAIDESNIDASHKNRLKKALGGIRTRISSPRGDHGDQ